MRRLLPALALAFGLLAVSPAGAQYYDEEQLPNVEEVLVFVDDGVRDGCLPQPNVLKVAAELVLRRSGIKVVESKEKGRLTHGLFIGANGYAPRAVPHFCSASLRVELRRFQYQRDETVGLVVAASFGGVYSGPKASFQQQLREVVNERVTALANEILKARGR